MEGISRGQPYMLGCECARLVNVILANRRRFVHECLESLVGGIQVVSVAQRQVAMNDLLKSLGRRYELFPSAGEL